MGAVEDLLATIDDGMARDARTQIANGEPLFTPIHNFLESVRNWETALTDDRTVLDVSVDARVAERNGWIERTTDGANNPIWTLTSAGEQALAASIDAIDCEELAEIADMESGDRRLWRHAFAYGLAVGGLYVAFVGLVVWALASL